MSCWFSCFYATLLPWPRAVIKQQAYKKTIAPVHFRRLCQGFNSEINSEETSWWLLRSHSWLDESVSIICLSVVTLCCSRSHLWPMLMWSRTGAITDEVNSWTGIKVLYESSIWFIASTEGGVLLSLDFDGAQVWSGFTVERERERECRPGIKALGHLEEQEPIECCSNPWTVKVGARKC